MNEKYEYTNKDALKFMNTLALMLGVSPKNVVKAYEDPYYYIMKEAQLPVDVDAMKVDLKDSLERQNIAKVLSQGLNEEVGYVLPLNFGETKWLSSGWTFRRGELFLIPGNSPVGLRLPMDSLEQKPKAELAPHFEPDLFADVPGFDKLRKDARARYEKMIKAKDAQDIMFVRTALNIEIRDGKLYIFLPPLNHTQAFLDLMVCIERDSKKT